MTDSPKTFAELGVEPAICRALEDSGITTPFPIQELTLPLALSRADVIGQARTGTGKTLAFGIPLLQAVDPSRGDTQALVIVPTRELCLQVHDDLATAGKGRGISTLSIYGGKTIESQSGALDAGVQVVVGTPGRLLDLKRRGFLDLSGVTTLVLDEADEMLDMGFLPDVEQLIEACATDRQTLLFSATMPSEVVGLARRYMRKPTFMRADVEEPQIAPETRQVFLACHRLDKPAVLARILSTPKRGLCVVFTRTKRMADVLVTELADHGVKASAIHSNLRQDARERTMDRFRRGKVDVLCATEVAARGLDISDVTHVVNYDCPDDEKMYLHRIGRTGRAGAGGVAVTLVVWNEQARLEMIKKALDIDAPTHEVFSTSPELDELFDLPPKEAGGASVGTQREAAPTAKRGSSPGAKRESQRTGGGRSDKGGAAPTRTRRRGGRNRSRTRSEASRRDEATAPEAPQAPEAAESAPEAAPETVAPEEAADQSATRETPTGQARAGADEPERVRVRKRSRSTRPAPSARPPGADERPRKGRGKPAPDAESGADADADQPAADASAEGEPADAKSGADQAEEASGGKRDASQRRPRDRSDRKRSSRQPSKGDRGRGGDRSRRGESNGRRDDRKQATPDADTARGEGQPALTRPMTIAHLP